LLNEIECSMANHYNEVTHLILKTAKPSLELYCCLTTVTHIVEEKWLSDSHTKLELQGKYMFLTIKIT